MLGDETREPENHYPDRGAGDPLDLYRMYHFLIPHANMMVR